MKWVQPCPRTPHSHIHPTSIHHHLPNNRLNNPFLPCASTTSSTYLTRIDPCGASSSTRSPSHASSSPNTWKSPTKYRRVVPSWLSWVAFWTSASLTAMLPCRVERDRRPWKEHGRASRIVPWGARAVSENGAALSRVCYIGHAS